MKSTVIQLNGSSKRLSILVLGSLCHADTLSLFEYERSHSDLFHHIFHYSGNRIRIKHCTMITHKQISVYVNVAYNFQNHNKPKVTLYLLKCMKSPAKRFLNLGWETPAIWVNFTVINV